MMFTSVHVLYEREQKCKAENMKLVSCKIKKKKPVNLVNRLSSP